MNLWGLTWGDTWGTSWGGNAIVEEHPERYSVGSPGGISAEPSLRPTAPGRRRRQAGREDARRRAVRRSDEEAMLLIL